MEVAREAAALDRRFRVQPALVPSIRPTDIGVDPAAYLPRDIDELVVEALGRALNSSSPWLVVVCGPSKMGKSRTLFEALRWTSENHEELLLIAPTDGEAARSLLAPGQFPDVGSSRPVVWLDDLEVFVAEGVGLDILRELNACSGSIVVGTYGGKGSERIKEASTAEISVLTDVLLLHGTQVSLGDTSPSELARLPPDLSVASRHAIEQHGLAATMVAAPSLERKLATRRHAPGEDECPEGAAVVSAVIDWARCGRVEAVTDEVLRSLWPSYLPAGRSPTDAAFSSGLEWALRPVAGTIALLQNVGGYVPFDYITSYVESQPGSRPPSEEAWEKALDDADGRQAFIVGARAGRFGLDGLLETAMVVASTDKYDDEVAGGAFFNLGLLMAQRGDLDAAIDAYGKSAERKFPLGAYNLGVLLAERGDLDAAEAAYRNADKYGSADGAFNLAALLADRGDFEEAEAAYRRSEHRGDCDAAFNLGLLRADRGDLAGAEAAYRRADERGNPDGTCNLGGLLAGRGDTEEAKEAFRRADERGDASSAYNLGVLLAEEGDQDGAEAAYRRADERGSMDGTLNLGVLLVDRDEIEEAKEAFQKADEHNDPRGSYNLGGLLSEQGEVEGAEAAYRRADDLGHGGAPGNLGVLLVQKGKFREAEAAFRRSDELGDGNGAGNLGALLYERGDLKGAEEALRRADQREDPGGSYNLGGLLLERGDATEAEAAFKRAWSHGHPRGAFKYGLLLTSRRDLDEARIAFQYALDSDDGATREAAEAALWALDEYEENESD
jgi:tetratricopeptide (TPR) repeat protein